LDLSGRKVFPSTIQAKPVAQRVVTKKISLRFHRENKRIFSLKHLKSSKSTMLIENPETKNPSLHLRSRKEGEW